MPRGRTATVEAPVQLTSATGWIALAQVPAGTFHALKIEAEGTWSAEIAPSESVVQGAQSNAGGTTLSTQTRKITPHEASGRLYRAYWYVPDVKRWVKAVEENYSSGGVRNERFTDELESFKPAG
jgi:hypothetical protein